MIAINKHDSATEMQRLVLASIMCGEYRPEVLDDLGQCFTEKRYRAFLKELRQMHRDGIPVNDAPILLARAERSGIDRREFLELFDAVFNSAHLEFYANQLRQSYHRQQAALIAEDIQKRVEAGESITDLVEEIQQCNVDRKAVLRPATESLDALIESLAEKREPLYRLPEPFTGFEVGPGLINAIGGKPGGGKTSSIGQMVDGALRLNPDLRVIIANAESDLGMLHQRDLSRITGIHSSDIRFRRLSGSQLIEMTNAATELRERIKRVSELQETTFEGLQSLRGTTPGWIIVDYVQKFAPTDCEPRVGVSRVMGLLRDLTKEGFGVTAVSAIKRPQSGVYDDSKLDLSSFRESSEIEFNADSCYVLRDLGPEDSDENTRTVDLSCLKNRHGELLDLELIFHRSRLEFTRRSQGERWEVDNCHDNPFKRTEA